LALRWSWAALRLRDFDWHNVDPTRRLVHLYPFSPDELDNAGMRRHVAWRPEFKALDLLGERIDIADTRPADDLVDVVASVQPTYLQVQPTALQVMVGADRNRRLPDLRLSAVFCVGEYFPAASRKRIEQYLGCSIFDLYGSVECNYLAARCPRCGNFHVHAEVALVEAVDDAGNEVAPGETGKLLVTNLYNYAMPLIRYDHMDFASKAANHCEITLPAFDTIYGKERDPFMFPNGHIIRPGVLPEDIIDLLGARMIQIAQIAPDRCEIRIVPGSLDRAQMRFEEMTDLLRKTWWNGLQVDYRIVDGFSRSTPRAKFQMTKQEYYKRSDIPGG
jgi:phenylacetate-CoA ligase